MFLTRLDEDYDVELKGITLVSFYKTYGHWIDFCTASTVNKRYLFTNTIMLIISEKKGASTSVNTLFGSPAGKLLLAICLLGRRILVVTQACVYNTDLFLLRIYSLLKVPALNCVTYFLGRLQNNFSH